MSWKKRSYSSWEVEVLGVFIVLLMLLLLLIALVKTVIVLRCGWKVLLKILFYYRNTIIWIEQIWSCAFIFIAKKVLFWRRASLRNLKSHFLSALLPWFSPFALVFPHYDLSYLCLYVLDPRKKGDWNFIERMQCWFWKYLYLFFASSYFYNDDVFIFSESKNYRLLHSYFRKQSKLMLLFYFWILLSFTRINPFFDVKDESFGHMTFMTFG